MPQVDGNVKHERVKELSLINEKLNKKYINKTKHYNHKVLVEEFDGEYYIGHTENYIKCYIPEKCNINEFVDVKIKEQYKDGVIANKLNLSD